MYPNWTIVLIFFSPSLKKSNSNGFKTFKYSKNVLHSILLGGHEKYIFIHGLKNLRDRRDIFFLIKLDMDNQKYRIIDWWKPLEKNYYVRKGSKFSTKVF